MIDALQASVVVLVLGVTLGIAWLIAPYIANVFRRKPNRLDRFLNPVENGIYRLLGVDPGRGMGWKEYFFSGLAVNVVQMAIAFVILTFQGSLPLNPQKFRGLSWDLSLNTVISMATNTNLQHYAGERSLSILSQMGAIQFLQFTSAATGICMGIAMVRALISGSKDMGNFYVDFVRSLTRILIPICAVAALILVYLGIPQTLNAYTLVNTVQAGAQKILIGPVASLVSIMQVGTNGGGFYGANSAYPFQNPNVPTDILEMGLMLLLPTALIFVFGDLLGKRKESKPILIAAYGLFALDLGIAFIPTQTIGPLMEVRFGGFLSNFWTVVTTAVTTGSVNASLAGIHPLPILSAFMGMLIQATPGGKGVGLMYMLMYIVITVFVVGLMSGRTPEYLGIKITGRDVLIVMVAFLVHPLIILLPTLAAYATGAAQSMVAATGLSGTHATTLNFIQVLYEYTSAAANNGSDFLGTAANTVFFNVTTGVVMFLGRFVPIGLLMGLGGSMMGRTRTSQVGLRTDSLVFSLVLIGSIIILVVLTFFPFLALGPILSYLQGNVNGIG